MELKEIKKVNNDNKGLSIVELLISIAILSIVGIAITAFITMGSQSYGKTTAEVDLQYDAQIAMNQLQDYLVDATECINFSADPSGLSKTLTIVTYDKQTSKNIAHIITWTGADGTAAENTLYYQQKNVTKTETVGLVPSYALGSDICANTLMSEYIIDFDVDYSKLSTKNTVNVKVKYKKGSREYDTNHNITVRNDLAVYDVVEAVSAPGGGGFTGTVDSVKISPKSVVAGMGTTHNFRAIVLGNGPISQAVSWDYDAVAGYTKADVGSYISLDTATGRLQINTAAPGDPIPACLQDFIITVRCVDNPATTTVDESTISDSAHVYVKEITDVTVSGPLECEQGKEASFVAAVAGMNLSTADQAVRWTLVSGGAYVTQTGDGKFKVNTTAPAGAKFSVKATSTIKPSVSSTPWVVTIKEATAEEPPAEVLPTATITGKTELVRGETGTYKATVNNMSDAYELRWVVTFTGTNKKTKKSTEYEENTAYSVTKNGNTCKVTVLSTFDYDSTASIAVQAYIVKVGQGVSASMTPEVLRVNVPTVGLRFSDSQKLVYYIRNDVEEYVTYELTGITAGKLDWVVSDKSLLRISVNTNKKRISLGVPSINSKGVATLQPKIGTKTLDSKVTVTVKTGNIDFEQDGIRYVGYVAGPGQEGFLGVEEKAKFEGRYSGASKWPQIERNPYLETGYLYFGYLAPYSDWEGYHEGQWYLGYYDSMNWNPMVGYFKWNSRTQEWERFSHYL